MSDWVKWLFWLFAAAMILINAALTFSFGFAYLGPAFGAGEMANYAGAVYALLLFDVAYLAWFAVYLRIADGIHQRSLAAGLAVFSLAGSLAATLQQLATNATALVDLTEYHNTVGLIALLAMLIMTAAHIVGTAAYQYFDPAEKVRQFVASMKARAQEDGIEAAEKAMQQADYSRLVSAIQNETRKTVLSAMRFTDDVKRIGGPAASPSAASTHPARSGDSGGNGVQKRPGLAPGIYPVDPTNRAESVHRPAAVDPSDPDLRPSPPPQRPVTTNSDNEAIVATTEGTRFDHP